jgi:hypothetical protein
MFTLVCLFFVLYLGYVLLKPRFLEGLDGDQAVTENPIQKIKKKVEAICSDSSLIKSNDKVQDLCAEYLLLS